MGATLTTHRVDTTGEHWPLVREYLGHSLRSLSECASTFLGRNVSGDGEDGDGYLPSAYPRYLTLEQFEEVFGMLVADARPHFAFFQHAGSTVCAHHVFCSLALLARADLHAKVQYVLRLYATNAHGQLPTERRRMLLRDFLAAVPRVLSLVEPIEISIVSYLEKELLARDDSSLATCRELYDFCFTTARISGFLHDIQSAVSELAGIREKDVRSGDQPTGSNVHSKATLARRGSAESSRLKLLNRGATMLQLPLAPILWSMRACDFECFWRQDHVVLPEDTSVRDALRTMKNQHDAQAVLLSASHSTNYAGLLTLDDLLTFFVDLLPEDASSTPVMGEYMRIQVVKAGQVFVHSTLRTVLASVQEPRRQRGFTRSQSSTSKHQCVADDERLFNVILRLACGAQAVAVLAGSSPSSLTAAVTIDPLLGRISVFDALEWLLHDVSLMNGKERYAIASFPCFYYAPTVIDLHPETKLAQMRPWLLDAVVDIRMQKTTGVLLRVTADEQQLTGERAFVLSAESIREVFAAEECRESDAHNGCTLDALTPLLTLLSSLPRAFERACFTQGDDSIAHVIETMVTNHARRVYIKDPHSGTIQGVVRATDILRLLLQEQHRCPRVM